LLTDSYCLTTPFWEKLGNSTEAFTVYSGALVIRCQQFTRISKAEFSIFLFLFFSMFQKFVSMSGCTKKHRELSCVSCYSVSLVLLNKVIHQIMQVIFWLVIPKLIREEQVKLIMTILLLMFIFQFLPKVYHSIHIMRKMQKVTGYIFGTIWWGFGLNLFAYFIASHVSIPFLHN